MENRRKLLVALLLIAGLLVMIDAYVQGIVVAYPIGLSVVLLGSIFWVNAE
jgi:hypothetical protein